MGEIDDKTTTAHLLQFVEMPEQGKILFRPEECQGGTVINPVCFTSIGNYHPAGFKTGHQNT